MRVAILVAVVVAVVGVACSNHTDKFVIYENDTAVTLMLVSDGYDLITLKSGQESGDFVLRKELMPDRIQAYDEAGILVFDRTYTWEDVRDAGWRITITDERESIYPSPTLDVNPTETPAPP